MSTSSVSSNPASNLLAQTSAYDQKANRGLQDRGTISERVSQIKSTQDRVDQNHNFSARQATVEALTHNTEINNTPVTRRGSLLDISA